jgi:hypothetical protein
MHKIGAYQTSLFDGVGDVFEESVFHFVGARFEYLNQIAVSALKVLENLGEFPRGGFWIQRKNPSDNMICAGFVSRVEIPRLYRRPERTHDHSCRIGAKIKALAVQKLGSDEMSPG